MPLDSALKEDSIQLAVCSLQTRQTVSTVVIIAAISKHIKGIDVYMNTSLNVIFC